MPLLVIKLQLLDVIVLLRLAIRVHWHIVGETAWLVLVISYGSSTRSIDS